MASFGGDVPRDQTTSRVFPATLRSINYVADLFNIEGIILTFSTHWDSKKLTNCSTNVSQSTKESYIPREKKIDFSYFHDLKESRKVITIH